ncbi:hypothetical protein E2R58_15205 [Paenibacillus amylolyticus]|uniref:hypothetical protein n=1 Tax=Paenibacillus amylolyticus TaxID=1451 RepID=UPI001059DF74|nr:hypothetical protein [Paenibacillus amylolyticus]TDL70426.1 hypothetical protein E2R58_15205 [Paenibacillus amylolyticus]
MKKILLILSSVLLIVLTACGSKTSSITKDDIEIVNVHTKEKVSYGMSRVEAEKVLGKGEMGSENNFDYEKGVEITYKDDKVISIGLGKDSDGIFETSHGLKIGMLGSEITELYGGSQNKMDLSDDRFLVFSYEAKKGEFIHTFPATTEGAPEVQIYTFTFYIDYNQYVGSIDLTDMTPQK